MVQTWGAGHINKQLKDENRIYEGREIVIPTKKEFKFFMRSEDMQIQLTSTISELGNVTASYRIKMNDPIIRSLIQTQNNICKNKMIKLPNEDTIDEYYPLKKANYRIIENGKTRYIPAEKLEKEMFSRREK